MEEGESNASVDLGVEGQDDPESFKKEGT